MVSEETDRGRERQRERKREGRRERQRVGWRETRRGRWEQGGEQPSLVCSQLHHEMGKRRNSQRFSGPQPCPAQSLPPARGHPRWHHGDSAFRLPLPEGKGPHREKALTTSEHTLDGSPLTTDSRVPTPRHTTVGRPSGPRAEEADISILRAATSFLGHQKHLLKCQALCIRARQPS